MKYRKRLHNVDHIVTAAKETEEMENVGNGKCRKLKTDRRDA
jgi:hypothetical protein